MYVDHEKLKAELVAQTNEVLSNQRCKLIEELHAQRPSAQMSDAELIEMRARIRLCELKKNGDNLLTFDELMNNGAQICDIQNVIKGERLGEVHASPKMLKMAKKAMSYDMRTGGAGMCARGANTVTIDTLNYDYRSHMQNVPPTFWRPKASAPIQPYQNTATAQISTMHNNEQFICLDFESNMSGNPDIANVKASGTIVGFSGEKNAVQPAGHITVLGTDGKWHTDCTESMETICSDRVATRYGYGGKGKYSLIFLSDATVSDEVALDILRQQYTRELNMMENIEARMHNTNENVSSNNMMAMNMGNTR